MPKKLTTKIYLEQLKHRRDDNAGFYNYSKAVYDNGKKVLIICPIHGEFWQWPKDHRSGSGCPKCGKETAKLTNIERYGVDNIFKRIDIIEAAMLAKHGYRNPGLMPDHVNKMKQTNLDQYGVEWSAQSDQIKLQRKKTNQLRYGCDYPMQTDEFKNKMMKTKIANGSFTKSNSSKIATKYFRQYVIDKGYDWDQIAFADLDNGLHEWGYYVGKWYLFDFVAFKKGHRGDKSYILEIIEFNGPFHYTINDVKNRGNEKAYPWKSNNTTIKESYENDQRKYEIAKTFTNNFFIVNENE